MKIKRNLTGHSQITESIETDSSSLKGSHNIMEDHSKRTYSDMFKDDRFSEFFSDQDVSIESSFGLKKDIIISRMIQYIIYLINDNTLRRDIMLYYIKFLGLESEYKWCGTLNLVLNESSNSIMYSKEVIEESSIDGQYVFSDLVNLQQQQQKKSFKFNDMDYKKVFQLIKTNQSKFTEKKYNLFTVVLVYDGHACHYVSFVYVKEKRLLITFDSGILLYPRGQNTIVPVIKNIFKDLKLIDSKSDDKKHVYDLGKCHKTYCGKQYGIQFNGEVSRDRPADAFCQSWSIFFLYRFMVSNGNLNFLKDWCKVPPKDRECFVLTFFLIPTLLKFDRAKNHYMKSLKEILGEKVSFSEVIHILTSYVEKNLLHRFQEEEIVCPYQKKS